MRFSTCVCLKVNNLLIKWLDNFKDFSYVKTNLIYKERIMKVKTSTFSAGTANFNRLLITCISLLVFSQLSFGQVLPKHFTQSVIVDKQYLNQFNEAENHFEHQDYLRAISEYEHLAELDPKNAMFAYKAGICHLYKYEDAIKAVEYMEQAKSLGVKLQFFEYFLGRAYALNYRFDDALVHYNIYAEENLDAPSRAEINRLIEQAETAKELIQNPVVTAIKNIGSPINSAYSEYVPVTSSDESVLIFTYRGEKSKGGLMDESYNKNEEIGEYYEDIYISYRVGNNWLDPEPIGDNINSLGHDACIALSSDGQKLFIFKSSKKDNGDIFKSELEGEVWSKPVKMPEPINSKYWDGSVSLSGDESVIFFASERPGGYGGRDIYQSTRQPDGKWGTPINMGSTINTKFDDDAPFIHPDDKTLYFSSQGHKGMGGYDVFKSVLENGEWSKPQNIGSPVNTPGDDIYFVVSASGADGYYSSGKPGGLGQQDIYVVDMNQVGEKPVLAMIKGSVFAGGKPVKASIKVENMDRGNASGPFASNAATGKYLLTLPPGNKYRLVFSVPGYKDKAEYVDVKTLQTYVEVTRDFQFEVNVQVDNADTTESIQTRLEQKLKEIQEIKAMQSIEAFKTGKNCDETIKLLNSDEVKQIEFAKGPAYKDLVTNYGSQQSPGETYKIMIALGKNATDFNAAGFDKYGKIESNLFTDGYLRFYLGTYKTFKEADDIKKQINTDKPEHCLALVQVNNRGISEFYQEKMKKSLGFTAPVADNTKKEKVTETKKEEPVMAKKEEARVEEKKEVAAETKKEETIVAKKEEAPIEEKNEVATETKKEEPAVAKKEEAPIEERKEVATETSKEEAVAAKKEEVPIKEKKESVNETKKEEPVIARKEEVPAKEKKEEPVIAKKAKTPVEEKKEEISKYEPKEENVVKRESTTETNTYEGGEVCDCKKYEGKNLNDIKGVYNPFVKSCGNVSQEGLVFRVQIGAYRHPENFKYDNVKGLAETDVKPYEDGITRFTMKEFTTFGEANAFREECIAKGVKDAWVIAFYNGKRTFLEDLIKANFFRRKAS